MLSPLSITAPGKRQQDESSLASCTCLYSHPGVQRSPGCKPPLDVSDRKVSGNLLHSPCTRCGGTLLQAVCMRSFQTSGCSGFYASSCHKQLWKGASRCLSKFQIWLVLVLTWKGSASTELLSVFPVPEPIRAINIGICLCMLNKNPVPRPVLQKTFKNSQRLFRHQYIKPPSSSPARRNGEQITITTTDRLVGTENERQGRWAGRRPQTVSPSPPPHHFRAS